MIERNAGHISRLPRVTTRDLNGVRRTLPTGRLNILLIAYQRWQQAAWPATKLMTDRIGRERGWAPITREDYEAGH